MVQYKNDEEFKEAITELLDKFCEYGPGVALSMYSHAIDPDGDWCVSPDRLEILFQEAEKRDIKFCTFKQWQEPYYKLLRN